MRNQTIDGIRDTVSVKVMDLGLVRIESTVHVEQEPAVRIVGTKGYQPPEQSQGMTVDQRSDVYSLGATMLALAADRSVSELDEWTSTSPGVDPAFVSMLRRMLSVSPEERPATMKDVQSKLESVRTAADLANCLKRAEAAAPSSDLSTFSWSVLTERSLAADTEGDIPATQRRHRSKGIIATLALVIIALTATVWRMATSQPAIAPSNGEAASSLEHRVARQIIQVGGRFDAVTVSGGIWNDQTVETIEAIADGPFSIDWIMLEHRPADDEILKLISQLKDLRGIGLSYSNVTDAGVKLLGNVEPLQHLMLFRTDVSDEGLEWVSRRPRLLQLVVSETGITNATLARLAACPDLEVLHMKDTSVNGEGLDHLSGLQKLNSIDLRDCPVNDADIPRLVKLKALRALYLHKTYVTEQGLSQLVDLPELRLLEISGEELTEAAAERLRQLMPDCQIERDIDSP